MPVTMPPSLSPDNDESQNKTIDDVAAYEPGHATELLSQSVQKLNVTDTKDDFRTQASKIINSMLESRLNNQKNAIKSSKVPNGSAKTYSVPIVDAVDTIGHNNNKMKMINNNNINIMNNNKDEIGINNVYTNVVNGKRMHGSINNNTTIAKSISSNNSSSGNSSCSASDRSVSPPSPSMKGNAEDILGKLSSAMPSPPPLPPAMPAFHLNNININNNNANNSNLNHIINKKSVSPVRDDITANILPTSATTTINASANDSITNKNNMNINKNNNNNNANTNNNHNNNNTSTITDMPHAISDNSTIVGTVHNRIGGPTKPGVTFSPNLTQTHLEPPHDHQHHQRNAVAYRNKSPAELTAHARDRRSFIDHTINTNGPTQTRNSQTYAQQANAIAAKLQDGEHPVCTVCHIKIAR